MLSYWLVTLLAATQAAMVLIPKPVVEFSVSHPAFVTLMPNNTVPSNPTWNILVSRFNGVPFSRDYISLVRDIGNPKSQDSSHVEDISNSLHWPNEPGSIPDNVFNRSEMVIIPSGFLVPTKGQGALTVFDLSGTGQSQEGPFPVTSGSDGTWFYHRAVWLDMDGDGLKDIVACRANKPLFGSEKGQMIWLRQPDNAVSPWQVPWLETVLSEGDGAPDTFMITVEMALPTGSKVQTLLTAGFFSTSLDIWWRKDETKPWSSDNMNKRVIDNTEGDTFDLLWVDLNRDNKSELLVTYNKPKNGTVFIYDFPQDFRTGAFKKTMILHGIDPAKSGVGKGAPGGIKVTWPRQNDTSGIPDIILSGDDNGKLYLLRQTMTPIADWVYTSTVILDSSPGTIGAMDVGDIDFDNYTDIIVPSYDENKITILTYKPDTTSVPPPLSTTTEHPSLSGLSEDIKQWFHWFWG